MNKNLDDTFFWNYGGRKLAVESLKENQEEKRPPKCIWRIKVHADGYSFWATMRSGKTVWNRLGDAKNALRYHAGYCGIPWSSFYDLITHGVIEFVKIS